MRSSPGTSPQSSPRVPSKTEQNPSTGKTTSPKPTNQVSPRTSEAIYSRCGRNVIVMLFAASKRRPMSGQMMKRVTLWEQQSSTNLNPPPPAGPSPSGSASSSPQHSTPRDSAQPPPDLAKALQGAGVEPKRFPFIPKTVSVTQVLRVTAVTMVTLTCCHWKQDSGEDYLKPSSHAGGKRNSYDEARLVLYRALAMSNFACKLFDNVQV